MAQASLSLKHLSSHQYLALPLPLLRAVQIHSNTRPTRRTDRIRLETGRPNYSSGLSAGLHHQKPISMGRASIFLKNRKTRTNRKISRFWPKFSESGEKTQILAKIFQNPMIKPRFRWFFFHFSALFPLDPVRFWPDLAKSHRIQWDFRQIWRNLIKSGEIFIGSMFFPLFSHHPKSD